jgi:hypothetical protein
MSTEWGQSGELSLLFLLFKMLLIFIPYIVRSWNRDVNRVGREQSPRLFFCYLKCSTSSFLGLRSTLPHPHSCKSSHSIPCHFPLDLIFIDVMFNIKLFVLSAMTQLKMNCTSYELCPCYLVLEGDKSLAKSRASIPSKRWLLLYYFLHYFEFGRD